MMIGRGESGYLREYGVQTHLVQSYEDVQGFFRWLGQRRDRLGCDTECEGLRPEQDRIRLIQFGDLHDGWAIPWDDYRGVAREVFQRYDGRYVFHNSKYDIRMIHHWSDIRVPWDRVDDTMTMAHLVDPLRPKGLKPLAARWVDPEAIASQTMLHDAMARERWDWKTVPMDYPWYWIYAALDPVLTCHIWQDLHESVENSYAKPYEIEMGATRELSRMEANGMRVDLDYCQSKYDELKGFADKGRQWLVDECGITGISAPQLISYFRQQGVQLIDKQTASGNQAMDKEVLEAIDHPVATMILRIKRAEKLAEPYFRHFLSSADENSRVHPNVWSMGARTGRSSITDPALQTLPKRDTIVRNAFVPDEGNALVSVDYHQVEARLMAFFSGSRSMQEAFLEGDFFCNLAQKVFQKPKVEKHDIERKLVKGVCYGKLYGAGVSKMAETAGVPYAQMEHAAHVFDSEYPEVARFQAMVEQIGMERERDEEVAYIKTPTGRRLVADEGKVYTLVNYLIQGHAAELLKMAMVRVQTECDQKFGVDTVRLLIPIHDEIVSECPRDIAPEVTSVIEEAMAWHEYTPELLADGAWSDKSWGILTEE